jgi:hypothetical protein
MRAWVPVNGAHMPITISDALTPGSAAIAGRGVASTMLVSAAETASAITRNHRNLSMFDPFSVDGVPSRESLL